MGDDDVTDFDTFDPAEGDEPRPEFVEELLGRLEDTWRSREDGPRTDPSSDPIDMAVFEQGNEPMGKNRLTALLVAAAAAVIVIVGLVVITSDDNDDTEVDTADPPEAGDTPTDEPAVDDVPGGDGAPEETTTTEPPTTTTTEALPDGSFDITYVEVGTNGPVAANDEFAWVAQDATLTAIELATNTVVSTADIPAEHRWLNHGFGSVWIVHRNGTVSRFDPDTGTVVATIDIGGAGGWIQPGPYAVWVSTGSEIVRIDPDSNEIASRTDLGRSAGAVGVNDDGVWTRDNAGTVHRIDPATALITASIPTPSGGSPNMAGDEGVWASGGESGSVYRIDPETDTVASEISVVEPATGSVGGIHVGGGSVWVRYDECSEGPCRTGIARIDPETEEVLARTDLREGWQFSGGMNTGPTTAWTFNPDTIARIDF